MTTVEKKLRLKWFKTSETAKKQTWKFKNVVSRWNNKTSLLSAAKEADHHANVSLWWNEFTHPEVLLLVDKLPVYSQSEEEPETFISRDRDTPTTACECRKLPDMVNNRQDVSGVNLVLFNLQSSGYFHTVKEEGEN